MPKPKSSTTSRKSQKFYDIRTIIDGLTSPTYFQVAGDLCGLNDGDLVLLDRARKRPKDGDFVVWGTVEDGLTIGFYSKDDSWDSKNIFGIGVTLIRHFATKKKAKRKTALTEDPALPRLRTTLDKLERVPENEAERFKLETEIYQLERRTEEWPDTIAA